MGGKHNEINSALQKSKSPQPKCGRLHLRAEAKLDPRRNNGALSRPRCKIISIDKRY